MLPECVLAACVHGGCHGVQPGSALYALRMRRPARCRPGCWSSRPCSCRRWWRSRCTQVCLRFQTQDHLYKALISRTGIHLTSFHNIMSHMQVLTIYMHMHSPSVLWLIIAASADTCTQPAMRFQVWRHRGVLTHQYILLRYRRRRRHRPWICFWRRWPQLGHRHRAGL